MSLCDQLRARIAQAGPMPVAEYMAMCLTHPEHGYYTSRDPLGAAGDFITAPEISQMFGELVGLALAQAWLDQGAPSPFTLAELGPGRGTLMADALRASARVPGFIDAARLVLVETSPVLREAQRAALAGHDISFAESVAALPEAATFLIANEFFDALPIRQYVREGAAWRERQVGLSDGAFAFGLGGPVTPALLAARDDVAEGGLVEICPAAEGIVFEVAGRIARHGGAALIIDYGDWRSLGDTLQAMRGHAPDPLLAHPGEADLTAHVDFEVLAQAAGAAGAAHSRLTPQGVFLERLGIAQRARALAAGLDGKRRTEHVAGHRRLTHPDEMGTLFKVLGVVPEGANMLPGLDP